MTQEERDKVVELLVDKWVGKKHREESKEAWRKQCEQFTDEGLLIAIFNSSLTTPDN